eukprot:scaffold65792_cov17-Tisochrysis_lutea.AAC.2
MACHNSWAVTLRGTMPQVLLGNEVLPLLSREEIPISTFRQAVEGVAGACWGGSFGMKREAVTELLKYRFTLWLKF